MEAAKLAKAVTSIAKPKTTPRYFRLHGNSVEKFTWMIQSRWRPAGWGRILKETIRERNTLLSRQRSRKQNRMRAAIRGPWSRSKASQCRCQRTRDKLCRYWHDSN